MRRRVKTERELAREDTLDRMKFAASLPLVPSHWMSAEYNGERRRLWRVALAAVRRDIKQRKPVTP